MYACLPVMSVSLPCFHFTLLQETLLSISKPLQKNEQLAFDQYPIFIGHFTYMGSKHEDTEDRSSVRPLAERELLRLIATRDICKRKDAVGEKERIREREKDRAREGEGILRRLYWSERDFV